MRYRVRQKILVPLVLAGFGAIALLALRVQVPGPSEPGATRGPDATAAACPSALRRGADEPGRAAWFTFRDRSDSNGSLIGYVLRLARGGSSDVTGLELPAEAFADGPYDDGALVGSDDGQVSTLRLLGPRGCGRVLRTASDVIIRRATIDPGSRQLVTFHLARDTRQDLGVWTAPIDDPGSLRELLPPLPPSDAFGITFATSLRWSQDGQRLVVESCGQSECRYRIVDIGTGQVVTVDDPGYDQVVGLVGDRLYLIEACGARPCPIVERDLQSRATRQVLAGALSAGLVTRGTRTTLVANVYRGPAVGVTLVDLATGSERPLLLPALLNGFSVAISGPGGSVGLPPGWIALGPDGLLPDPPSGAQLFAIDVETARLAILVGGNR